MKAALLALLVALLPTPGPQLSNAFPRAGARQLLDNERVTVWEVTVEKGKATLLPQHPLDAVLVDLADASVKVTSRNGGTGMNSVKKGHVGFIQKGSGDDQEGVSDTPRRSIIVELKDVKIAPLPNKSGYPDAFPREGAAKVLDNSRVTVWDVSWTLGKATPTHFHGRDVVVVYLDNAEMSSTTPDGKTTVNSTTFGQVKFNPRDRTHSELLSKGAQRVIAIELK